MWGTGRSDPIVQPYTDRDHALDITAVVRAAGGGPMVGVAVSAAPYWLVRAAVADPRLFKKLVLVGGDPGADAYPHGHAFPRPERSNRRSLGGISSARPAFSYRASCPSRAPRSSSSSRSGPICACPRRRS